MAKTLGWTRHETPYEKLDEFAQGMAAMETKAHLDLLVARGQAATTTDGTGVVWYLPPARDGGVGVPAHA